MSKKIRDGRLRLGESEEQFARRFGVTRPTVQQWEREGGTAPKLDRITDVADAIGVTLDDLIANRKADGSPAPSSDEYVIHQYKTGGATTTRPAATTAATGLCIRHCKRYHCRCNRSQESTSFHGQYPLCCRAIRVARLADKRLACLWLRFCCFFNPNT